MNLKELEFYNDIIFDNLQEELKLYSSLFIPDKNFYDFDLNAILKLQKLAKLILTKLDIKFNDVIVYFENNIEHPGQIELNNNEYFIEINKKYEDDYYSIGAILAHEIMHIFLSQKGIWLKDEYKNEVLTDIATIYFGLGLLILNGQKTKKEITEGIHYNTYYTIKQSLGYLQSIEIGYLFNRYLFYNDFEIRNFDVLNPTALEVFNKGQKKFKEELKNFNYVKKIYRKYIKKKERVNKLLKYLINYNSEFANFSVTINSNFIIKCPFCLKSYKMPGIKNKINFKCKRCNFSFII